MKEWHIFLTSDFNNTPFQVLRENFQNKSAVEINTNHGNENKQRLLTQSK